ncbi:MAG: MBL fold metallo-hydrolase RNA specificity domain-containing protein [archaeon]
MAEISSNPGGGFLIRESDFSILLDGKTASGLSFVSHAHTDHLPGKLLPDALGIASKETRAFARERWGLELPESPRINRVKLSDAGHMVGSKMISVETKAGKVLYTGDFSTRDRFFLKGARPEECKVLIVDATFGKPEFSFPRLDSVIDSAKEFLEASGSRAIFYGYSYGKAQLLTRIASELSIPVIAQAEVFAANRISEKFNHPVGASLLFGTKQADKLIHSKDPVIVVAPLTVKNTPFSARLEKSGFRSAVFTGWAAGARFFRGYSSAIPLSDHADFQEILDFVSGCNPEKVVVAHTKKDAPILSALRVLGFEAVPATGNRLSVKI